MITIHLPFPDPRLNPNRCKGVHWAATTALRKSARAAAFYLTKQAAAGVTFPMGQEIALVIVFVQPDRRHRDRDNLLAASKPALDGVADALGINDSQFQPVTIVREFGAKPGAVRIEIGNPS
jgi:crossover junction endodeoxyribonuclease RusA